MYHKMSDTKQLVVLRRKIKQRKPVFIVKESNFSARVKRRWRFPRGKHSAMRQMHRGRPKLVTPGFGSPKAAKGLHSSGLQEVLVNNISELLSLNPLAQGAVLASGIGGRKKLDLLTLANDKKIPVLNVKDPALAADEIKKKFTERVRLRQEKQQQKTKKQEEKTKKAEEKKTKEEQDKKNQEAVGNEEKIEQKSAQLEKEKKSQQEMIEKTLTKRQ